MCVNIHYIHRLCINRKYKKVVVKYVGMEALHPLRYRPMNLGPTDSGTRGVRDRLHPDLNPLGLFLCERLRL